MEFAPVLPPELYRQFDTGKYHLVQAHTIKRNKRMLEWCLSRRSFGHTVILDNGAAELGSADITSLIAVASHIRPTIVVCPDVFGNRVGTYAMFMQYANKMNQLADHVMVVPHGRNVDDAIECAADMVRFWNYHSSWGTMHLGIPKLLDHYEAYGRTRAVTMIVGKLRFPQERIHLLGINHALFELDHIISRFPRIAGVDSTLPCAVGLHECGMVNAPKARLSDEDWKLSLADLSIPQHQAIKSNIDYVRMYVL